MLEEALKMIRYVHDTPGRLRINISTLKNDTIDSRRNYAKIKDVLEECCGVFSVNCNFITGSVVIEYKDFVTNSSSILKVLHRAGFQVSTDASKNPIQLSSETGRFISKIAMNFALNSIGLDLVSCLL